MASFVQNQCASVTDSPRATWNRVNPPETAHPVHEFSKPAHPTVPAAPGPQPLSPPAEGRPWGGSGFVRSKSMCTRNRFSANNSGALKPARNSTFRARVFKMAQTARAGRGTPVVAGVPRRLRTWTGGRKGPQPSTSGCCRRAQHLAQRVNHLARSGFSGPRQPPSPNSPTPPAHPPQSRKTGRSYPAASPGSTPARTPGPPPSAACPQSAPPYLGLR